MTDEVLASRSDRRVAESKKSRSKTTRNKKAPSKQRSILLFIRDLLIIFVVALLISFMIKTFLIRSFYIPSGSMENTLQIDDRIIVNQLEPELIPITRGDVIVFKDPGGWLLPQAEIVQNPIVAGADWLLSVVGLSAPDSNDHLIKRVIGLPGDHVVCCNTLGQMSVNDVPLDESAYVLLPAGETKVSKDAFDVTIPADSLWMMGDNRYNSKDSRYNGDTAGKGYVPVENVVGRALVVSWPLANWAWLDDYPDVFREVEHADQGAE